MNQKTTLMAVAAVVGAIVLGGLAVSASAKSSVGQNYGRGQGRGLEQRAEVLGVDVETLRQAAEQGKSTYDVAKEKGLSLEEFKTKMREAAKKRWEAKGLSAEEIAEREKAQAERQANCDGGGQNRGGGFGRQLHR